MLNYSTVLIYKNMNFKQWIENNDDFQIEHDTDYTFLMINNQQVGEIHTSQGGMIEERNVQQIMGDAYQNQSVRRTNGVFVEDQYQGQGYGKILWLSHMAQFPNTLFFNSQTWAPATNLFNALAAKNLMKIHWVRPPEYNTEGGPHVCYITPQGMAFLNQNLPQ